MATAEEFPIIIRAEDKASDVFAAMATKAKLSLSKTVATSKTVLANNTSDLNAMMTRFGSGMTKFDTTTAATLKGLRFSFRDTFGAIAGSFNKDITLMSNRGSAFGRVMRIALGGGAAIVAFQTARMMLNRINSSLMEAVKHQDALAEGGGKFKKLEDAYKGLFDKVASGIVKSQAFKDVMDKVTDLFNDPATVKGLTVYAAALMDIVSAGVKLADVLLRIAEAVTQVDETTENSLIQERMDLQLKQLRRENKDGIPLGVGDRVLLPGQSADQFDQRITQPDLLDRGMLTGTGMATRAVMTAQPSMPLVDEIQQTFSGFIAGAENPVTRMMEQTAEGLQSLRETAQGEIKAMGSTFDKFGKTTVVQADHIDNAMRNMGNGMADAMFNAIDAVITGQQTIGQAMRMIAAESIKALVADARVKAVYEMGEAFMWLARGNPFSFAMHMASAAKYGLIAGVGTAAASALSSGGGGNNGRQQDSFTDRRRREDELAVTRPAEQQQRGNLNVTVQIMGNVVGNAQFVRQLSEEIKRQVSDGRNLGLQVRRA